LQNLPILIQPSYFQPTFWVYKIRIPENFHCLDSFEVSFPENLQPRGQSHLVKSKDQKNLCWRSSISSFAFFYVKRGGQYQFRFGFEKFPFRSKKISSDWVKKNAIKGGLALYLLRIKSMLGWGQGQK